MSNSELSTPTSSPENSASNSPESLSNLRPNDDAPSIPATAPIGATSLSECVGDAIVKTNETHFDVLFDATHPLTPRLKKFFDYAIGGFNYVTDAELASHVVLLPNPDSTFPAVQVEWCEVLFRRFKTEANLYEFDRFENKLVVRNIETIRARRALS